MLKNKKILCTKDNYTAIVLNEKEVAILDNKGNIVHKIPCLYKNIKNEKWMWDALIDSYTIGKHMATTYSELIIEDF